MLARALHQTGHDVVVLSRRPQPRPWRVVHWDAATLGPWRQEIDGADAVINLAGRSVNCRYHAANRREILDSRIASTTIVGEAIGHASCPPPVWLQASTATIYSHRYDEANDDHTGVLGGHEPDAPDTWRFSIDVARAWEQACEQADTPATRKVLLRSAMTLSADTGGAFDALLGLVRYGVGGRAGTGRQFMSWIHYEDFIAAVRWLLARRDMTGPVNLASPQPLPQAEFMRVLRNAYGMPFGLPASQWMLELGAAVLRTETELILKSRRVVPARLLESGFVFRFPHWPDAAGDLCEQWRASHRANGAEHARSSEAKSRANGAQLG